MKVRIFHVYWKGTVLMSVQNREDWMNFEKDRTQVGEWTG